MANKIYWSCENVEMPPLDYILVERWIMAVAADYGKTCGELGYLFCDDEKIIAANREFLNHDYYTDIITFDYSKGKKISGDMIISLETVRSNADLFRQPYECELLRVIIHGVLHLCGINDKGEGEREIMEQCEDKALRLYNELSDE
ncbi:MAG: rRNA maturation RNase YbeY [Paramuribaculum sp.]|nr:rRNA maturation RNase YbeY [Paramuribaculum sp.]